MAIGAIVINAAVSTILGNLFGILVGPKQDNRTLQVFLNTLSKDFASTVELQMRAAFTDQNFLQIKAKIISGATALRSYSTDKNAKNYLTKALSDILDARSLLFVEAEKVTLDYIFQNGRGHFLQEADPGKKWAAISLHQRAMEAAMVALQAVAALDLVSLCAKAAYAPNIKGEIIQRINEYDALGQKLAGAYIFSQNWRVWEGEKALIGGMRLRLIYTDGVEKQENTIPFHENERRAKLDESYKKVQALVAANQAQANAQINSDERGIGKSAAKWREIERAL